MQVGYTGVCVCVWLGEERDRVCVDKTAPSSFITEAAGCFCGINCANSIHLRENYALLTLFSILYGLMAQFCWEEISIIQAPGQSHF